jgi:hypothetical protein
MLRGTLVIAGLLYFGIPLVLTFMLWVIIIDLVAVGAVIALVALAVWYMMKHPQFTIGVVGIFVVGGILYLVTGI